MPERPAAQAADWNGTTYFFDSDEVCGAKMITVKGCLSEQLLRCNDVRGEYISMATWDSMGSIEAYRESQPHKEIREATRGLTNDAVVVKTYEVAR